MNSNSRLLNSARNIFFGVGNQIIILILNFVQRTLFINLLGAEYLGINGLFSNILSFLCLADLGLGTAMIYSFYEPIANKDEHKISALITYYRKIYLTIATAIFIMGMCLLPFVPDLVNLKTPMDLIELRIYYIIFLINTVISYLFVYQTSIVNADQNTYLISVYNVVFNILKIVGQILVLYFTHNYLLYLIVMVLSTFFTNYFSARKARKLYPFITKKEKLEKSERNLIFENIKSMFIYKISGVLLNSTDNIIISVLSGTIWVGYYSTYLMLVNSICNFICISFSSITGSIGNLVSKESDERKEEMFYVLTFIGFWLGAFTIACFYVLLNDFVKLWIGAENLLAISVVVAMLINYYMTCVMNPLWIYRSATGLFNQTKFIGIFTATINLIVSIILGKWLGLLGVLLGSSISRLVTSCWYEPMVLFKEYFKTKARKYFLKNIVYIVAVIVVVGTTYFVTAWIDSSNWIGLFEKLGLCLVVPNLVLLVLFFWTSEFKYLWSIVKRNIMKKV